MQEKTIKYENLIPHYGQVFVSDDHIQGLDSIHGFKGKKIINVSGGVSRLFVFEDSNDIESIVSALHQQQQDTIEYNGRTTFPIQQIIAAMEGDCKILSITSGKTHNVILTQDGKVYTYGFGEFGILGHGGSIFEEKPRLVRKLESRKIVSIACGMYHTLALSQYGDLYAWGRGFEGQLGIMKEVEACSAPRLVLSFYKYKKGHEVSKLEKKPITKIACGAYHSMAIDENGGLYCWGEARQGQTGTGKKIKEELPTQVQIAKAGVKQKAKMVAGGFGHTLCLTQEGDIFAWGANAKGQLGLCDQPEATQTASAPSIKVKYSPVLLQLDQAAQPLPRFKFISCGFNRSFAIDDQGYAWAWGGGNLGFKDSNSQRGPRKILENTQDRKFEYIVANQTAVAMFAKTRTTTFHPALCPSKGNTELTLFGTGFIDTGMQVIKFVLPNKTELVVQAGYDGETTAFYCKTPDFETADKNYPVECEVLVSLDGFVFEPFQQKLLVYPSSLTTTSVEPKSASIRSCIEVKLDIEIPEVVLAKIPHLTVGFQAAKQKQQEPQDEHNSLDSWMCVEGRYHNGKILCNTPSISKFDPANPFYHVDISLNSQQFTGFPTIFRFFDMSGLAISLAEGFPEGGYPITLTANGLFDSAQKQVQLRTSVPEKQKLKRQIEHLEWDKVEKKITFNMPPLTWLINDPAATPEHIQEIKSHPIQIWITLSGVEWDKAGNFMFVDPPPPPEPEQPKKDSKKQTKKAAKK